MARKPMITRTVTSTRALVLCVDTLTESTVLHEAEVARTYKDDSKLIEAVNKITPEELIPVKVISVEIVETLYGMEEQKFIENAEKLPPRTKTDNTETHENA